MDPELTAVKICLQSGQWDSAEAKQYAPFQSYLCVIDDSLVRGNKLVIPNALRQRMLTLAHEGHPGETNMKKRLRDRVWWPGIDKDAEKFVKQCEGFRLVGLPSRPLPTQRRVFPTMPWCHIAIDFLGPLPSSEWILAIIDY
ncbi:uncharacterized protein K02A2.6-like [Eupeodes corollae]|uniref:uncharacterized protein K02A2.6-like n=1 Tax=Eupeodes corollae TaxID=290404 RepID=UPI0024925B73|nr:uncharacterized protein K02A2.6-like [Eupeodes corollae]